MLETRMKAISSIKEGPGMFWVLILTSSLHLSFSMSLLNFWDANNSFKVFAPGSRYSRFFIPTTPVHHPFTQGKTNSLRGEVKEHNPEFGFELPHVNSIQKENFEKTPKKTEETLSLKLDAPSEIEVTYRSGQYLTFTLGNSLKVALEMWVPLGTHVTWIKRNDHRFYQGENVILDQFHHATGGAMKSVLEKFPHSDRSQFKMKLHSRFFIECPQEKDQGQYSVEVKTPGGEMKEFNFFLIGIQDYSFENKGNEATNCSNEVYPRIIDFAKEVRGKKGWELFLPCRHSHREVGMTVDWSRRVKVLREDNFAVTENDELHIFNLTESDGGWYKCTLQYNKEDGVDVYDTQITYVRVID